MTSAPASAIANSPAADQALARASLADRIRRDAKIIVSAYVAHHADEIGPAEIRRMIELVEITLRAERGQG